MAGSTSQVSVGTTATLVLTGAQESSGLTSDAAIVNTSATTAVYLGYSNAVTTANGFYLGAGQTFAGPLYPGDTLYAVAASGTVTVGTMLVDR
jgi:acyl dehydratase